MFEAIRKRCAANERAVPTASRAENKSQRAWREYCTATAIRCVLISMGIRQWRCNYKYAEIFINIRGARARAVGGNKLTVASMEPSVCARCAAHGRTVHAVSRAEGAFECAWRLRMRPTPFTGLKPAHGLAARVGSSPHAVWMRALVPPGPDPFDCSQVFFWIGFFNRGLFVFALVLL